MNSQLEAMTTLANFWGHDGLLRSVAGDGAPTPDAAHMPPLPPPGRRARLQVMDGNYVKMSGACPWWDAVTAGR